MAVFVAELNRNYLADAPPYGPHLRLFFQATRSSLLWKGFELSLFEPTKKKGQIAKIPIISETVCKNTLFSNKLQEYPENKEEIAQVPNLQRYSTVNLMCPRQTICKNTQENWIIPGCDSNSNLTEFGRSFFA